MRLTMVAVRLRVLLFAKTASPLTREAAGPSSDLRTQIALN
jgi:hypothetical protein